MRFFLDLSSHGTPILRRPCIHRDLPRIVSMILSIPSSDGFETRSREDESTQAGVTSHESTSRKANVDRVAQREHDDRTRDKPCRSISSYVADAKEKQADGKGAVLRVAYGGRNLETERLTQKRSNSRILRGWREKTGKFIPEKSNIWRDCVDGYYDWVKEHIEEVSREECQASRRWRFEFSDGVKGASTSSSAPK